MRTELPIEIERLPTRDRKTQYLARYRDLTAVAETAAQAKATLIEDALIVANSPVTVIVFNDGTAMAVRQTGADSWVAEGFGCGSTIDNTQERAFESVSHQASVHGGISPMTPRWIAQLVERNPCPGVCCPTPPSTPATSNDDRASSMERFFKVKIQSTGDATPAQVFEELDNFELTLDIHPNERAIVPIAEATVTLQPVVQSVKEARCNEGDATPTDHNNGDCEPPCAMCKVIGQTWRIELFGGRGGLHGDQPFATVEVQAATEREALCKAAELGVTEHGILAQRTRIVETEVV